MSLRYFEIEEFDCQETGKNKMDFSFLERLDELRHRCGFPFTINSGYRDLTHSKEIVKERPGTHTQGIAADIAVSGGIQRRKVVEEALKMGFGGVGVAKTFVHVDDRRTFPMMWEY